MRRHDIVILSTADWDNPFWTNKQHVAVELARLGHRVFYIDSLGLRRPSATVQDFRRICRRGLKALRKPRLVRDNLWVWSPVALPWHKYALTQKLNAWMLQSGLAFWMAALGLRAELLWTYNPLTEKIINIGKFGATVYHCVDDIKQQPGMPAAILRETEQELCKIVDIIFVTSPALASSHSRWNANTHYLPNVADFEHFSQALDPALKIPGDIAKIPGPILGFIGAISSYKIDLELIRQLAAARPDWSIVMIGRVGEGDPWTDPALLGKFANIHMLGERGYDELPAYLKAFDIALMPNTLNEYTKSMFPMKFFEYLAAGKPIVSVDLHALQAFHDVAYLAKSLPDFIAGVESALAGDGAPLAARLAVAEKYTYKHRTQTMMELIEALPRRDYLRAEQPRIAIP